MNKDREELFINTHSRDKWERIGTGNRSGALVPLFSVYSRQSAGIGDFRDLELCVDWCVKTGNSILQLLPMNDVGMNFCPYDSTSSFALEPMYIVLGRLPGAENRQIKEAIAGLRESFSRPGEIFVDYRIKGEKSALLRKIFDQADTGSPDFAGFIRENQYWLDDFAVFNTLKGLQQGKAWFDWEESFRGRDPEALKRLRIGQEKTILFHKWVQWQAYLQFKSAKDYAASRSVLLKGDLPILASRDSADVWAHPEYFKMDLAAGAPPDMYCAKGQRWGTPTYNWERIFSDSGAYLKEKLRFAENFYDILRIDHVVGFFRIWSIPYAEPEENKGLNGFFDPGDEFQWEAHGRKILTFILDNTRMLLCAEDLGVIPYVCTKVLKELGIPGNDVQRWTKDWNSRNDFLLPAEFRRMSVAMLATHDTTNLAAWWENEAGTVDEALFARKCADRNIGFLSVKDRLFDPELSRHGRLRWLDCVDSVDCLVNILGQGHGRVMDFIDLYKNSYREKEKLWKLLGLSGPMRERSDKQIVKAALSYVLDSASIFVINLITDWLYLGGRFKDDPYVYRYNTPGTVNRVNWSLRLPLPLEELLEDENNPLIRSMIDNAQRGPFPSI